MKLMMFKCQDGSNAVEMKDNKSVTILILYEYCQYFISTRIILFKSETNQPTQTFRCYNLKYAIHRACVTPVPTMIQGIIFS